MESKISTPVIRWNRSNISGGIFSDALTTNLSAGKRAGSLVLIRCSMMFFSTVGTVISLVTLYLRKVSSTTSGVGGRRSRMTVAPQ